MRNRPRLETETVPAAAGTGPAKRRGGAERRGASSSETVVRGVVRGLYEGRYVAGQRLAEPDLMAAFGVGRGSVREAIKRLAAEGVVVNNPNRGAAIRHLTRREARDALLVLERLAGLAAAQAAEAVAEGADGTQLAEALAALQARVAAGGFEALRARNAVYREVIRLSGNAEIARLMPSMQVNLLRAQTRAAAPSGRLGDYAEMVAAVRAGDAARAEAAARGHIRRIADAMAHLPDTAFAREVGIG